jgi:excisionase family DNA binding protein
MAPSERRTKNVPRLMTVSEIASYLRVHPTTIYRLVKSGKMPSIRIGDSWRFDRDRIERWLKEGTKELPPK